MDGNEEFEDWDDIAVDVQQNLLLTLTQYINGALIQLRNIEEDDRNANEDANNFEDDVCDLLGLPPQEEIEENEGEEGEEEQQEQEEGLDAMQLEAGLEFADVRRALEVVPIDVIFNARSERGHTILHVIVDRLSVFHTCGKRSEYSQSLLKIATNRLAPNRSFELLRQQNTSGITLLQMTAKTDYVLFYEVIEIFKSHSNLTAEEVNELLTMRSNDGWNVIIYLSLHDIDLLSKFLEAFDDEQKVHLLDLLDPHTIEPLAAAYLVYDGLELLAADYARLVAPQKVSVEIRRMQLIQRAKHFIAQQQIAENNREQFMDNNNAIAFIENHDEQVLVELYIENIALLLRQQLPGEGRVEMNDLYREFLKLAREQFALETFATAQEDEIVPWIVPHKPELLRKIIRRLVPPVMQHIVTEYMNAHMDFGFCQPAISLIERVRRMHHLLPYQDFDFN